jgi:hypothetical protein
MLLLPLVQRETAGSKDQKLLFKKAFNIQLAFKLRSSRNTLGERVLDGSIIMESLKNRIKAVGFFDLLKKLGIDFVCHKNLHNYNYRITRP